MLHELPTSLERESSVPTESGRKDLRILVASFGYYGFEIESVCVHITPQLVVL